MASEIKITPLDQQLKPQLQARIDGKTKPPGALGKLESLALQIGLVQQTLEPLLHKPAILVFAGDHGICQEAVSPYPQAVTYQMLLNFLAGGAAINVFASQNGLTLNIIDAGVNADLAGSALLTDAKIAKGTANFLHGPAMTGPQCQSALQRGRQLAQQQVQAGSNIIGFGEMGIGNTTSASAIMSSLCQLPVADCTGRGTGLDDAGLLHKQAVITQALKLHSAALGKPLETLRCLGGFEIAMMVGAMLGSAEQGALLLIDGFISSSALLVASQLQPAILDYCIFSHCSAEAAHQRLLTFLNAQPLLNLDMRLGEGTGAALAYPIVQAAVNFLNQMASFESASVSQRAD